MRLWLCGGSAGVRWCLACPSSLLDTPCDAACAVLLRAERSRPWGRVGVPPILGHTGGGVHFPGSVWDEAVAGFWGVCGLVLGDLSDMRKRNLSRQALSDAEPNQPLSCLQERRTLVR